MYLRLVTTLPLLAIAVFQGRALAQTINPGGIVNIAGFQAPVAPGSAIAILGTGLAATPVSATALPLRTTLGGVSVLVNGALAPLFYVSPGQISAQLPYETPPGPATLSVNGSASVSFTVASSAPGIMTYGSNRAVVFNEDNSLNGPDHAAPSGGWVTVYVAGQGAVNPPVATGVASPGDVIAVPTLPVTATIGGQPADVLFASLMPGAVGLLEVNLRIPALAPGDYPLIVTIGQAASNAPLISVSGDGRPVLSIVHTIAYHQLTSLPDKGPDYRNSTALSGNGAVIAFAHDSGPNQVWVMNFDGSGQRQVDRTNLSVIQPSQLG